MENPGIVFDGIKEKALSCFESQLTKSVATEAPAVLMRPDAFPWQLTHPVAYFEGVYGMVLLREQILGPDRFDRAFRKYTYATGRTNILRPPTSFEQLKAKPART
jgi:hypothetical protein